MKPLKLSYERLALLVPWFRVHEPGGRSRSEPVAGALPTHGTRPRRTWCSDCEFARTHDCRRARSKIGQNTPVLGKTTVLHGLKAVKNPGETAKPRAQCPVKERRKTAEQEAIRRPSHA